MSQVPSPLEGQVLSASGRERKVGLGPGSEEARHTPVPRRGVDLGTKCPSIQTMVPKGLVLQP